MNRYHGLLGSQNGSDLPSALGLVYSNPPCLTPALEIPWATHVSMHSGD